MAIAIGRGNNRINVWLFRRLKIIKSLRIDFLINLFKFSLDDHYIYVEHWQNFFVKSFVGNIQ